MFVLTTIADVIPLAPHQFGQPDEQSLRNNILEKYAKKVVQNVGLCISFWDFLKISDGNIVGGEPEVFVNVTFRLVVFRPFKGEILQGIIASQNKDGIRIHTNFFHDIWVPGNFLHKEAAFKSNEGESLWQWDISDEPYYYDNAEPVRFRVEAEIWHNQSPGEPKEIETDSTGNKIIQYRHTQVPYTIVGAMDVDGLGPIFWWEESAEAGS